MTPVQQARERLAEALRASDEIGAPEVYCTREDARLLLDGPTEEEVARAVLQATPAMKGGWDAAYQIARSVLALFGRKS